MNKYTKIAIVSPFGLLGHGLKHVLEEYFNQHDCRIFTSMSELMQHSPDCYDFYFLNPDYILKHYEFFMPRKMRTVVLSNDHEQFNSFHTLPLNCDLSYTIDTLQQIFNKLMNSKKENSQDELSAREIDVLKLIAKGLMNKEIAEQLCISLNTVLTHRKNITSKLGIKTVSGLTFYAMMHGY